MFFIILKFTNVTFVLSGVKKIMQLTDQEILDLLKIDGSKAIELIFKKFYRDLCMISNRYIKDTNHAEDLVQELLYDIWNKRDKLNINSSLSSYLKKSVVNRSLNHIRSKRVVIEEDNKAISITNKNPSIQQNMEKEELEKFFNEKIDALPEKCRLVFIMSRFEQMSYKEIAAKLDISTKTVENQISKALRNLRAEMELRNQNI